MRLKPNADLTTNARVFTAVYIGTLVMGPPVGAWAVPECLRPCSGLVVLASLVAIPLGGLVAGLIGGRDHGLRAALTALFLSNSAFVAEVLLDAIAWRNLAGALASLAVQALLMGTLIGLVAVGGMALAERYRLADRLQYWKHWRKAGIFLVLLFIYSLTLGRYVAGWRAGYSGSEAYPVGVYIAVAREPLPGLPGNPTHYLDPTGLLEVGYYCIRH